jgi:hypothetical protein
MTQNNSDEWSRELFSFLTNHFAARLPHGQLIQNSFHIEVIEARSYPDLIIEIKLYPYGKTL